VLLLIGTMEGWIGAPMHACKLEILREIRGRISLSVEKVDRRWTLVVRNRSRANGREERAVRGHVTVRLPVEPSCK
jgi:hypothetical protein